MANRQDDNQPTDEADALIDDNLFDETLRRSLSKCTVPLNLRLRLLARVQTEAAGAQETLHAQETIRNEVETVGGRASCPEIASKRGTSWKWAGLALAASLLLTVLGFQLLDQRRTSNQLTVLCVQELVPHSNQPEWTNGPLPVFWESLTRDVRLPGYQLIGRRQAEHCVVWKLAAPGRNEVFVLDFSDDYRFEGLGDRLTPQSPLGSWSFAAALYQNRVVVVTMLGGDVSRFLQSHPSA